MKNKYQLTITSHETGVESIYTGTIEEICEKSRSSKNIILAATRCTEVITKNHRLTIKKLPNRGFDFINLWDGGLAFDAEIYSREEAIEKFKKESWEATEMPECTEKWARSECRNDIHEMDGPGHCYIIYDEPVKRSFRV